jgi:hypothetical protein
VSEASYAFGIWRLVKPGTSPASWPFTPLKIGKTGIEWEQSQTTRSGLFGRKSETVGTQLTVPLADVRNAKCSWLPGSSEGDIYYLYFTTAQGDDVVFALALPDASEIARDQLREATAVLKAYDIPVDDRHDLL